MACTDNIDKLFAHHFDHHAVLVEVTSMDRVPTDHKNFVRVENYPAELKPYPDEVGYLVPNRHFENIRRYRLVCASDAR